MRKSTRRYALKCGRAYFITTARGFIHDEAALLEALRDKRIAGAGLDVWSKDQRRIVCSSTMCWRDRHTAGVAREARINMGKIAAEQIVDTLDGKRPPRLINPEVWPAYVDVKRVFGFYAEVAVRGPFASAAACPSETVSRRDACGARRFLIFFKRSKLVLKVCRAETSLTASANPTKAVKAMP